MTPPTSRRILVIEDEALVAMLVEDALLDAGFEVIGPARSVAQALALLAAEAPNAAVLDLNLGGENSVARGRCARRARHPLRGRHRLWRGRVCRPTHRNAPVLPKPYDPADLTAVLERLCSARA